MISIARNAVLLCQQRNAVEVFNHLTRRILHHSIFSNGITPRLKSGERAAAILHYEAAAILHYEDEKRGRS
jgi:hypothetical protein